VGWIRNGEAISQYNVLKRFDASGKLLATSAINAKGNLSFQYEATEDSLLRSSKDRVGWLTRGNEYNRVGLDGRELGRFHAPTWSSPQSFETSFALGENNEVLVGTRDGDGLKLWSLDRDMHSWNPVELSGAKLSRYALLGFDGDGVVVVDGMNSTGLKFLVHDLDGKMSKTRFRISPCTDEGDVNHS